jgi:hypothetical protein
LLIDIIFKKEQSAAFNFLIMAPDSMNGAKPISQSVMTRDEIDNVYDFTFTYGKVTSLLFPIKDITIDFFYLNDSVFFLMNQRAPASLECFIT